MYASLVLGLVFGFDDGRSSFNLILYLANILKFIILSLILLFIYYRTQKFIAKKTGATTKINLWKLDNFKIPFTNKKRQFPLWIIIPILVSLFSEGQLFFAALITTGIVVKPAYRIGRKYSRLTEMEQARILVSGPIVMILIALLFNPFFKEIALVSSMIAVFSMLPLPGLAGMEIFFGSRTLYLVSLVFILVIAFFSKILSSPVILALAILVAVIALIANLWFFYKKKK